MRWDGMWEMEYEYEENLPNGALGRFNLIKIYILTFIIKC